MRRRLTLAGLWPAFFMLGLLAAPARADDDSERLHQRQFERGLQELQMGRPAQAALLFEALHASTGSLRVKLEWARALYLDRQYARARALFNEVLAAEAPAAVARNVRHFLRDIEQQSVRVDYSLYLQRDTNPFGRSRPQTVFVYGLPFDYQPQGEDKTYTGLGVNLGLTVRLPTDSEWRWFGQYGGIFYDLHGNSRDLTSTGLQWDTGRQYAQTWRVGLSAYRLGHSVAYQGPFASTHWRLGGDDASGFWSGSGRWETFRYPRHPDLNAHRLTLALNYRKPLTADTLLDLDLSWVRHHSHRPSDSHRDMAWELALDHDLPSLSSTWRLSVRNQRVRHDGENELFQIQRRDTRTQWALSVSPHTLRIMGLAPTLEWSHERIRSSIPIENTSRAFVQMTLRKPL